MTLKEQLAEKKSALSALEKKIDAGDLEAIKSGENITEDTKTLEKAIASAEKAKEMLGKMGKAEKEEATGDGIKSAVTIGEHFVKNRKAVGNGGHFEITAPDY